MLRCNFSNPKVATCNVSNALPHHHLRHYQRCIHNSSAPPLGRQRALTLVLGQPALAAACTSCWDDAFAALRALVHDTIGIECPAAGEERPTCCESWGLGST
jgi:hypothetical protein